LLSCSSVYPCSDRNRIPVSSPTTLRSTAGPTSQAIQPVMPRFMHSRSTLPRLNAKVRATMGGEASYRATRERLAGNGGTSLSGGCGVNGVHEFTPCLVVGSWIRPGLRCHLDSRDGTGRSVSGARQSPQQERGLRRGERGCPQLLEYAGMGGEVRLAVQARASRRAADVHDPQPRRARELQDGKRPGRGRRSPQPAGQAGPPSPSRRRRSGAAPLPR
jgi:hypothetical protein